MMMTIMMMMMMSEIQGSAYSRSARCAGRESISLKLYMTFCFERHSPRHSSKEEERKKPRATIACCQAAIDRVAAEHFGPYL